MNLYLSGVGRSTHLLLASLMFFGVFASAHAQISFVDVSSQAGISPDIQPSYGVSAGDVNGDGRPDFFINNHALRHTLYLNNGDSTFTDALSQIDVEGYFTGSGTWEDTHGASWIDFDNDGDQDLVVTTGVCCDPQVMLNVDGALYHRSVELGFGGDSDKGGRMPIWFDSDDNGLLEVALLTFHGAPLLELAGGSFANAKGGTGLSCHDNMFGVLIDLNDDDTLELICVTNGGPFAQAWDMSTRPFTDVTASLGPVTGVNEVIIGDFDRNLRNDMLLLDGDLRPSEAYAFGNKIEAAFNNGNRGFSFATSGVIEVQLDWNRSWTNFGNINIGAGSVHPSSESFTLDPNSPSVEGMAVRPPGATIPEWYIGYDASTGRWTFDMYQASVWTTAYMEVQSQTAITGLEVHGLTARDKPRKPLLLSNLPSGMTDTTNQANLQAKVECAGGVAADFDNDMDTDIYLLCRGGVRNLPNMLLENNGSGVFSVVPGAGGAEGITGAAVKDLAGTADTAVLADYDLDGRMDILVTNGLNLRPEKRVGGPVQLMRNQSPAGNWIQLDLVGTLSARDAVGARVYVTAGGIEQLREQNEGYRRVSHDFRRLHFGLGGNTTASIEIVWPDGSTDTHEDVNANEFYRATQGGSIEPIQFDEPPSVPQVCGEPTITNAVDRATFLWKDCDGSEVWHLRTTGGGTPSQINFTGTIESTGGLVSIIPVSLEGSDVMDTTSNPDALSYELKVWNTGVDGFDFQVAPNACFTPTGPGNLPVLLGGSRSPLAWASLDLTTEQACAVAVDTDGDGLSDDDELNIHGTNPNEPDTDFGGINDGQEVSNGTDPLDPSDDQSLSANDVCGEPSISRQTERATFLWQSCDGSNQWSLRVTGGGTPSGINFEGTIDGGALLSLTEVGIEGSDVLDQTPAGLNYTMLIYNNGLDGIDFVPAANGCYRPVGPANLPVYLGANKVELAEGEVNLANVGTSCN